MFRFKFGLVFSFGLGLDRGRCFSLGLRVD